MQFRYEKLENGGEQSRSHSPPVHTVRPIAVILIAVTTFLLGIGIGVFATSPARTPSSKGLLAPAGSHSTVLHYNKTFGSAPSPSVDDAWSSIFPVGRGFVQHAEYAPNISGVAVFHELHCLNALRLSLYEARGETGTETGANASTPHRHHHAPFHHVRHCIDYLRQSLMCHADTNLEPVDWEAGGVTGWGSERRCRDYGGVVAWANEFRTHNQTAIS